MRFRLVRKSVILNDLERCNGPYFSLFHRIRVRYVVVKQLLGLLQFQNLLLIVYSLHRVRKNGTTLFLPLTLLVLANFQNSFNQQA